MSPDEQLMLDLFETGAFQVGSFTLKSGQKSPFYFDLRLLISHPPVLQRIAHALNVRASDVAYSRICAIPYAGLPIGTAMALDSGEPLIYPRKEVKEYGTQKSIEGFYRQGERVLIVDDLITNGASKEETIRPLQEAGLVITDILVIIDREQGGVSAMDKLGWTVHSLFTVTQLLTFLHHEKKITDLVFQDAMRYVKGSV